MVSIIIDNIAAVRVEQVPGAGTLLSSCRPLFRQARYCGTKVLVQARDKRGRVLSRAGAAAQGFRMGLGGVMVMSRLQSRVGGVQE